MQDSLPLDGLRLKKGALVLRALKNELRQKMLLLIHQKKRITVTEIYMTLKIEQSVASQQLAILRQACFVKTQREGKQVYYAINYDRLYSVSETIAKMVGK